MTYVSHPVRAIRDDPVAGESVTLLLRVEDGAALDEVAAAVRELGGTVEAELEFETLAVTVDQAAVADVVKQDLDGQYDGGPPVCHAARSPPITRSSSNGSWVSPQPPSGRQRSRRIRFCHWRLLPSSHHSTRP